MSDTLTVYWANGEFFDPALNPDNLKHMLHAKPESLLSFIHGEKTPYANQTSCPAMKARLNNVFVLKSAVDEDFEIDLNQVNEVNETDVVVEYPVNSKARVMKFRPTNLKGYYNIVYMTTWLFYASEPLLAKLTAPYYPAFSPIPKALLAPGEYDVGRWFRPISLDYHIPLDQNHFVMQKGDPLLFIEFMTDKKIEFKRFEYDSVLHGYVREHIASPSMYGKNKPLEERYQMAEDAQMRDLIMSRIKKNLV